MATRTDKLSPDELAVVVAMADMRLRPGQMLLLGPQSVRLLKGLDGGFQGFLPDKHTFERKEWCNERH